jgi:hypothetical protein
MSLARFQLFVHHESMHADKDLPPEVALDQFCRCKLKQDGNCTRDLLTESKRKKKRK